MELEKKFCSVCGRLYRKEQLRCWPPRPPHYLKTCDCVEEDLTTEKVSDIVQTSQQQGA